MNTERSSIRRQLALFEVVLEVWTSNIGEKDTQSHASAPQ